MKRLTTYLRLGSSILVLSWGLVGHLTAQETSSEVSARPPVVDSLIREAATSDDTLTAVYLYAEARQWAAQDLQITYDLMLASAKLSKRLQFAPGLINAYRGLSSLNGLSGRLDSALFYVERGLQLVHLAASPAEERMNLMINKGVAYTRASMVTEAIAANLAAYELATTHGFSAKASMILHNMGILYRKQARYAEALEAYHKSLEIKEQLEDVQGQANTYFNIGSVYSKMDSLPKAITAIQQAKQQYAQLGQSTEVQECDLALGHAYLDSGQASAAYALLAPLADNPHLNFSADKDYNLHLLLAELALERGALAETEYLLDAISGVTDSQFEEEKTTYYRIRSELAQASGDHSAALSNYQEYIRLQAVLDDDEKERFRETLIQQFQAKEKDLEISNLNQLNRAQEVALSARNAALRWGTGALILLISLLYALYQLYRKNRRNQVQLSRQNTQLAVALDQNQLLVQEIHHRVKNNLQVISSLLSMQERKMIDPTTKDALRSSKSRIQSMTILHQTLYQGDSVKSISAKVYLEELAQHLMDTYQPTADIKLTLDVASIPLDIDTLIPLGLISNELLTNALKHAFPGRAQGRLELALQLEDEQLILKVADDGVGLDGLDFPTRQGSLGTRLVRAFTQRLDGELRVDTTSGTCVEMVFSRPE